MVTEQYEAASVVIELSCAAADHWLVLHGDGSRRKSGGGGDTKEEEGKDMRFQTMNKYVLLSECHYQTSNNKKNNKKNNDDGNESLAALTCSIRALELCDREVDVQTRVVKVVKREIHLLENSGGKKGKKKKKDKKKDKKRKKKKGSLTALPEEAEEEEERRVPWLQLYNSSSSSSSRRVLLLLRLYAASSYRFYYREYLPDAGTGEAAAMRILQRCQEEHETAVAGEEDEDVLLLGTIAVAAVVAVAAVAAVVAVALGIDMQR